ncbi:hypothetical protein OE88DRAFT_305557 [Heliocybe sulcata]|uniref:Uncharacterized protein n=1 Tax=Heliocybe sulcata TaxID=5364 RepID=A0A5C3N0K7_9AGAM|nr:hypothetical protein OE88DRAFT_305557 [Heliocybe sulcata]
MLPVIFLVIQPAPVLTLVGTAPIPLTTSLVPSAPMNMAPDTREMCARAWIQFKRNINDRRSFTE